MATYDGKKALIVDDFPTARRLIKETLQEIGFECVEAADVDQALKLFDEEKVDLVIADTFMPEKNGMDLLKTLRENPENDELEIVLTMMEDHEELVSQGEALGMTGYVLKPFDVFSLSKSLDQMHKNKILWIDIQPSLYCLFKRTAQALSQQYTAFL